jgi:hypothetical protein
MGGMLEPDMTLPGAYQDHFRVIIVIKTSGGYSGVVLGVGNCPGISV